MMITVPTKMNLKTSKKKEVLPKIQKTPQSIQRCSCKISPQPIQICQKKMSTPQARSMIRRMNLPLSPPQARSMLQRINLPPRSQIISQHTRPKTRKRKKSCSASVANGSSSKHRLSQLKVTVDSLPQRTKSYK